MRRHPIRTYAWALLSAVLFASGLRAEDAKTDSSGQLKAVVIEGVSRIQMKGDKPSFNPRVDPRKPVGDFLTQRLQTSNIATPEDRFTLNTPIYLPSRLDSDMVVSPWNHRLMTPPVLSLTLKAPSFLLLSQWRLIITDDKGRVFRLIKGRGHLPGSLAWDGLGNKGEPIQVGHSYAYSLSLLDQASVPTYVSGKTVRVKSYVYEQSRRLLVSIETGELFDVGRDFSAEGLNIMGEVRDRLRKFLDGGITIDVYGTDNDLAQRQAEMLRKNLEQALHLPEGSISSRGHVVNEDGYLRTQIGASL